MTTLRGSPEFTFLAMLESNVRVHGMLWAYRYCRKHGMPEWELEFWFSRDWRYVHDAIGG